MISKNTNAIVIHFQVQVHTLNASRKLNHLTGLDLIESIDTRNAVTNGQDLPNLGDFGFEASYGFFDAAVGNGERRLRDLDTRLCMGIENTNAVLVIGYRSVRVDGTHDGGADSTVIDVAFGGPYLGLTFGF